MVGSSRLRDLPNELSELSSSVERRREKKPPEEVFVFVFVFVFVCVFVGE
jgi:hypothetical protein